MKTPDRPRFRVSADRQSGSRRVRYVETNHPDSQNCTICQLDEENPPPMEERPSSPSGTRGENHDAKPERS